MQVLMTQLITGFGGAVPQQAAVSVPVVDASGPVRASAAFALLILVGGVLLQRRGEFIADSVDAALARPLWSVGYGVASHAVFGFAAAYLASQLALVDVAGVEFGVIGPLVGGVLVALSGSVGFTVVGIAVADVWGTASDWPGLALGALLAGGVASLEPLLAGAAWVALVSFGIGGAVREWLQAPARPSL